MLPRVLARALSVAESPTADLYFRNACGAAIGRGVEQLAPTVFASDSACLVMRHPLRAGPLPKGRKLLYFLDDDLVEGPRDRGLPPLYRHRLRLVDAPAARRMLASADRVVVSSPLLGPPGADLIGPYRPGEMPGLDHFDGAESGGRIDIACLSSPVHRGDMDFLWPVLRRVLARVPQAVFHAASGHRRPSWAVGNRQVRALPQGSWRRWQRAMAGRRMHLALYPLVAGPFNRTRSSSKLVEHAFLGAAQVVSADWAEARHIRHGTSGLAVETREDAWIEALSGLLAEPDRLRPLAAGAQALAERLNTAGPQRRLWSRLMGIEIGEPA